MATRLSRGSRAYHPATLLAMLVYGYSTGVFSSRKLEMASYDSVAFRYIAAGSHPDHDTLATFRRRFMDEIAGLFVQVLEMAREMKLLKLLKLLKLGTVCLDGTKIHANASRHSALSHGHIVKLETRLQQEDLTDEESRIMPTAGGGFEQCYNAQAAVDAQTMLVVATTLTQATNDKQQVQPMIKVLQEQAPRLGDVQTLIADTGYCTQNNIKA